ncbi:hypothetical protein ACMGDM_15605 [Sphingomonas sp. DT-51]|uniref:hypothetical protein n=1 Tax=Sphingomonas sp. DT-51 TaxID=3396165 RepID=UPI003F1BA8C5
MPRDVRRNHQELASCQSQFRAMFSARPNDLAELLQARVFFSHLLRRFLAEQEGMLRDMLIKSYTDQQGINYALL